MSRTLKADALRRVDHATRPSDVTAMKTLISRGSVNGETGDTYVGITLPTSHGYDWLELKLFGGQLVTGTRFMSARVTTDAFSTLETGLDYHATWEGEDNAGALQGRDDVSTDEWFMSGDNQSTHTNHRWRGEYKIFNETANAFNMFGQLRFGRPGVRTVAGAWQNGLYQWFGTGTVDGLAFGLEFVANNVGGFNWRLMGVNL